MARDQDHSPHITCAENIALLSLLHTVPSQPTVNKPGDSSLALQKNYTLPFDQERSLAGTLAFLSSIKDDPDHIPAICIGEDPDANVLNVFVAVNKCRQSDGNNIIEGLKRGFERIFLILANVSIRSPDDERQSNSSSIEHEVLTAIVSMCSSRIPTRLRLRSNARNVIKTTIKEGLLEAIECAKRLRGDKNRKMNTATASFIKTARGVVKLVDSWYKHQAPTGLKSLVEGVYQLQKTGTVQSVLDFISNKDMDPSLRRSLVNMIGKVARYRQASKYLYRTAQKYPIVRKMRFVSVNLPQSAFQKPPVVEYQPEFAAALARVDPKYAKEKNISELCRILNTRERSVGEAFAEQMRKILRNAKVHAEIQLVAFCELHLPKLPPRVVCSTKDACYLCSMYIAVYEKRIHTPRCHGRLYPGWRLPFLSQLDSKQRVFNQALERKIKESLDSLLLRKARIDYPWPNESTLLTLPSSISTLHSVVRPGKNSMTSQQEIQHKTSKPSNHSLANTHSNISSNKLCPETIVSGPSIQFEDVLQPIDWTSNSQSSSHDCLLPRGVVLTRPTGSHKTSPLYIAGS